jgi:glycosyltransferase involved in cell wall biosynthesis
VTAVSAHSALDGTTPSTPAASVRVSLDVSAIPAAAAGAGRYVVALATALDKRTDVDLSLICRRDDSARWAGHDGSTLLPQSPNRRPARLVWEQIGLPGLLRHRHLDVHHAPHYTMPELARLSKVVTIHDCTFFDHPEWHERSKVVLFRRATRVAAARADAVICVSDTTARRLQEVVDVRAPITVAHHGVDHDRFRPDEPAPGSDEEVLAPLDIAPSRRIVLFVGTLEPRKGVGPLIQAFDRLTGNRPDAVLLLAGQRGWGRDEVKEEVARCRHPERIRTLGYVPDAALPALIRRAGVVAYPAFEEGFGLPALETLACGTPLVTTSGTAMEEIAGEAALLVRPGNVDELGSAVASILDGADESATRTRRDRGLTIAATYTWARTAEVHAALYRKVAR